MTEPGATAPYTLRDEILKSGHNDFVGHHDDQHQWQYTIWLNLTTQGQQASDDIVGKISDS